MALDKVLKIYDENGNPVDYDILASDVKFLPDGKDLPTKLTEMEDAIEDAAESGGYTPPAGGIPKTDLAPSVQTSLGLADTALQEADKIQLQAAINAVQTALNNLMNGQNVTDAIDTFNEVVDFLNGIDTDDPTLSNQLLALNNAISALQTALAGKISGIKANGASTTLPVDQNGIVELPPAGSTISPATASPSMDGTANVGSSDKYAREDHVHPHDTTKLSKSDVSVETQGDGTVDINVKDDTYTVNLNHTHENMAKLIVCEESDLPSTLDPATIYAITDSGETEIEKLIIRGMEFAGGGVPDTGEPMISSPSNGSTINLGTNEGSGVSKTITIKGKNLTGDLTVAVGTGLTISYGQALDASRVTIPMAQALLGAQVTIAYSGSGALDDGSLVISQGNDVLSSVVVVVVPTPEEITAVKFTGSQWLETDYYPNPNTEFELDCQFVANSHTEEAGLTPNGPCPYFISCEHEGDNRFNFQVGSKEAGSNTAYRICCYNNTKSTRCEITAFNASASHSGMTVRSTLAYSKQASSMSMTFNNASSSDTVPFKTNTMLSKLAIGYSYYFADEFNTFDLIIYGFKIMENGVTIKDYRPALYNGVPGLYDYENDDFISSKTSTKLVAITN